MPDVLNFDRLKKRIEEHARRYQTDEEYRKWFDSIQNKPNEEATAMKKIAGSIGK